MYYKTKSSKFLRLAGVLIIFSAQSFNSIQAYQPIPARSQLPLRWFIQETKELTKEKVSYDSSYYKINYPWGDVPSNKGACTDFVIRAFRRVGIDLQQAVCRHMAFYSDLYSRPDKPFVIDASIAHRRVKNLMVYFKHKAVDLPVSRKSKDYKPGDIVVWKIEKDIHIGIVVDIKSRKNPGRYLVAHHSIAKGPKIHDVLFAWKIIGHYRYF